MRAVEFQATSPAQLAAIGVEAESVAQQHVSSRRSPRSTQPRQAGDVVADSPSFQAASPRAAHSNTTFTHFENRVSGFKPPALAQHREAEHAPPGQRRSAEQPARASPWRTLNAPTAPSGHPWPEQADATMRIYCRLQTFAVSSLRHFQANAPRLTCRPGCALRCFKLAVLSQHAQPRVPSPVRLRHRSFKPPTPAQHAATS